jgi:hypothetical protein
VANTLLTPTAILREAGRIFHQTARFISRVDRRYDDKFAQSGAKVGASINLRDANAFNVTDGATMVVQNVTETYKTLTIDKRKHIALDFTSQELTLSIDDFSERYIKPQVAKLVATVEADALNTMRKQVANFVDGDAAAFSYLHVAQAKQVLDEHLTPEDGKRSLLLCPAHATKYLDASKGFYNPSGKLGAQYGSGIVEDFTGFDIGATSHLAPVITTGTAAKTTGYTVNGTTQSGSTITIQTGSTTFKVGDVVTFAGAYAVHPETKAAYSYLEKFVVTADSGTSATTLSISPALTVTGPKQNVSAYPDNTGAVVKVGAGASETLIESLAFHKDAFVFASVDLEDMSKYGGWGAREDMDGISMRLWRMGDIQNDSAPCRLDVLYGFLTRYPQLACRIHADG